MDNSFRYGLSLIGGLLLLACSAFASALIVNSSALAFALLTAGAVVTAFSSWQLRDELALLVRGQRGEFPASCLKVFHQARQGHVRFGDRRLFGLLLAATISVGYGAFVGSAVAIAQDFYQVTPEASGVLFMLTGIAFMIGSLSARFLVARIGVERAPAPTGWSSLKISSKSSFRRGPRRRTLGRSR